jgi:hypothetical protein
MSSVDCNGNPKDQYETLQIIYMKSTEKQVIMHVNELKLIVFFIINKVSMLFAENRITEKKDRRKSMVCFYAFVWEFRRSEYSAIFLFDDEVQNP